MEGISNYQTGTAMLAQGYGSRKYELNNRYRLRIYSGFGCSPNITELKYEAKNQGIEFMIDNFGYMKNTYTGYYPQKPEIAEVLSKTNKSTIKPNYEKGFFELKINNELIKVYIDTKTYLGDLEAKSKTKIDQKLVFNYTNIRWLSSDYKEYLAVKAVFIKDCLIIQSLETKNVYLIDSKKGLVFTEYGSHEFSNI